MTFGSRGGKNGQHDRAREVCPSRASPMIHANSDNDITGIDYSRSNDIPVRGTRY